MNKVAVSQAEASYRFSYKTDLYSLKMADQYDHVHPKGSTWGLKAVSVELGFH